MGVTILALNNTKRTDDTNNLYIPEIDFIQSPKEGHITYEEKATCYSGSCAYYNKWRKELFAMVSNEDIHDYWESADDSVEVENPFHYLINFCDNSGAIDTKYCEKLYRDFICWNNEAESHFEPHEYIIYKQFMLELKEVKDNGILFFH